MKKKPVSIHVLERPLANAIAPGGIGDAQRRAIWAKRKNPTAIAAPPRPMSQPTPFPHQLITVAPTPFPGQLMSKPAPASSLRILVGADGSKQFVQPVPPPPAQPHAVLPVTLPPVSPPPATPPAQQRKWGESRPGEMYMQVEGPGNPSWEKRHPEFAPAGGTTAPTPTPKPAAPPANKPSPPATPATPAPRQWGESRPGEMYFQVEGPGNPSWEKKHPELAPAGGTVAPPQHHLLDTPTTKTPRAASDIPYGSDGRTVPPADPNQAIRDKIDSIRQTLPATPPTVAAKPSFVRPTPGHPNPDKPYQTPPYIPPLRHGPVLSPTQPPFKVPPGVLRSKPQPKPVGPPLKFPKTKKSYVKNWYRGATPQ